MKNCKIIFSSRLDNDCSMGAHLLCDVALTLYKKYPNLKIYILGGGSEHPKIVEKVKSIDKINSQLIFAPGNVDNPQKYYDADTLFIGVSRSAMEAMACGCPVILLGNEGYLGLLEKDNLEKAIKTNLTCRKCKNIPSPQELYNEICKYFELSNDEKSRLASFSRNTAIKFFSAEVMAEKTLSFYTQIIQSQTKKNHKKIIKIALCGYYGRENFGDEVILSQICRKIKEKEKQLSHSNWQIKIKICIIKSKNPLKILNALTRADLFIFGGGSLLQNTTSDASFLFYISIIMAANILSKQSIMLSNGIGPFKKGMLSLKNTKSILVLALSCFDFISARDVESQTQLKKLVPHRKVHLVSDPAWIYFKNRYAEINQQLRNKKFIVYIPNAKALEKANISLERAVKNIELVCNGKEVQIIIATLSKTDYQKAKKTLNSKYKIVGIYSNSAQKLEKVMQSASLCITQRYHGALFASASNVPLFAISEDPKIKSICKELLLLPPFALSTLNNPASMKNACVNAGENHNSKLESRLEIMKRKISAADISLDKVIDIFI